MGIKMWVHQSVKFCKIISLTATNRENIRVRKIIQTAKCRHAKIQYKDNISQPIRQLQQVRRQGFPRSSARDKYNIKVTFQKSS